MDLDLRLVRYAVALADELHFGRAADRLMVTQQTLSAQLKQLETLLGVALFVRDRRHVEITPAGETFVARGRELLIAVDVMLNDTHSVARWDRRPLRVDVVAENHTPSRVVHEFQTRYPEVMVEIHQSLGLGGVQRVAAGELDIAFSRLGRPLPGGLVREAVRYEPICLMLPVEHPLAESPTVSVEQARAFQLLLHGAPGQTDWATWQEAFFEDLNFRDVVHLRGVGLAAAIDAVVLSGLPRLFTTSIPMPDTRIVCRPLVDPVPLYAWSAVWHRASTNASLEDFVNVLRALAVDGGWLDTPEQSWWMPAEDRSVAARSEPLAG